MTESQMTGLHLAVGIAMLLFGRRLFWVFLAGTGFVVGALAAARLLEGQSGTVLLAAALAAGILGALLALFAQKLAVGVAGFLAGGYLGHALALALHLAVPPWIAFVAGGIAGALLLVGLFNWALIVLSSLTGAAVVAQHAPLQSPWPMVVFAVLTLIGLAFQSRQLRRKDRPHRKADDDD